jgi:uncharacterized phage-associated protein
MFDTELMYDARAVANFFIDRASEKSRPITVMTLLKVLYFAHAWYLAKYDKPLVGQPFEAWQYGPVNRVVYEQLKVMGSRAIEKKLMSFDAENCSFGETPYRFDDDTVRFLADIFDYYAQFHPFSLSQLTHEKGSPWDIVWNEAETRAVPGMVIPDRLIMKWFREGGGEHGLATRKGYST